MSDDKTKKAPHDAKRVDINDRHEVRYRCDQFHCSKKMLRQAVANVGDSADDVEQEVERLKKVKRKRNLGR